MMLTPIKLFTVWLFGLMSGFTLMITSSSLNYWLAKEAIDVQSIGLFAIILLPYAINFLWAPIFDAIYLGKLSKLLGHRLSWMVSIQVLLVGTVFLLSTIPLTKDNLVLFALISLMISFLGSAQDDLLGAVRTEMVAKELQGFFAGIYIFGYRIGMLIAGSGAIYLSRYMGWNKVYKIFSLSILIIAAFMAMVMLYLKDTLLSEKAALGKQPHFYNPIGGINLIHFIKHILRPIGSASCIVLLLIFLMLYRLPDNFLTMMLNPFFIHIGYNEAEIATAGKFFGTLSAIMGGLLAGLLMKKKKVIDSLLLFGMLHGLSHLLLLLQAGYGKNLWLFFITTFFEGTTNGMAMTAYIAFISSLCHGQFRATQYSFFSAMMGVSRSIFPTLSGYIVVHFGWHNFFIFIILLTIPSLLLLLKIRSLSKSKVNL